MGSIHTRGNGFFVIFSRVRNIKSDVELRRLIQNVSKTGRKVGNATNKHITLPVPFEFEKLHFITNFIIFDINIPEASRGAV